MLKKRKKIKINKWLVTGFMLVIVVTGVITYVTISDKNTNNNPTKSALNESSPLTDSDIITENNLKIAVGKATRHNYEGEAKESEELVIVPIEILNIGESETTLGAIDFNLKLADKTELFVDANKEAFVIDLQPNQSMKKILFYKVKKGVESKELIYSSGIDKEVSLPIKK